MCNEPRNAWLPKKPNHLGKRLLQFKPPVLGELKYYDALLASCGHCITCKKLKNLKNAVQLYCELHTAKTDDNYFITLTYDDKNLPSDMSVRKLHLQKFIRSIRDNQRKKQLKATVRYQGQGENGGETLRPHYHLAVFGLPINDLQVYSLQNAGKPDEYCLYESAYLQNYWEYGSIKINELTLPNCVYIASHHINEKVLVSSVDRMKPIQHPVTGKIIFSLADEFTLYSTHPGLGFDFYQLYKHEIFINGCVRIRAQKLPIPRYFRELYKAEYPELYDEFVIRQTLKIKVDSPERMQYLELYQEALINRSRYE